MSLAIQLVVAGEENGGPFFGDFKLEQGGLANALQSVGLERRESTFGSLEGGLRPKGGWVTLGAYGHGWLVLGDQRLVGACEDEMPSALVERIARSQRGRSVLFVETSDAIGYGAAMLFRHGVLVRRLVVGSAGPARAFGTALEEEGGLDAEAAMALTTRFFGTTFDQLPMEEIPVESARIVGGLGWGVAELAQRLRRALLG